MKKWVGFCFFLFLSVLAILALDPLAASSADKTSSRATKSIPPRPTFKLSANFPKSPMIDELLWNDEFNLQYGGNLNALNSKYWLANVGSYSAHLPDVFSPDAISFKGSDHHLVITTSKILNPSLYTGLCEHSSILCQFKTGQISTRNKIFFRYGYFEIQARMPRGDGNWTGLWMLPKGNWGVKPTPGEIDIVERYGDHPNTAFSTLHYDSTSTAEPGKDDLSTQLSLKASTDLSKSFHTYGMLWLPGQITFFLDGRAGETLTTSKLESWPFDNFFYLIMDNYVADQPNKLLGGIWGNQVNSTTEIEWVRVWKANGVGEIANGAEQ